MTKMWSPLQDNFKTRLPTQVSKGRSLLESPNTTSRGHSEPWGRGPTPSPGPGKALSFQVLGMGRLSGVPAKAQPLGNPRPSSWTPSGPLCSWHPKDGLNPRVKGASKNF